MLQRANLIEQGEQQQQQQQQHRRNGMRHVEQKDYQAPVKIVFLKREKGEKSKQDERERKEV